MKIYAAYPWGDPLYTKDPERKRLLDKFVGKDLWFYVENYGWVRLLEQSASYLEWVDQVVPMYKFYCVSPEIAENLLTEPIDYRERILNFLPNDERTVPIYLVDDYWFPALEHPDCLTTEELFRLGEP